MEWKRILLWFSIFIIFVTFYRQTLNKWTTSSHLTREGLVGGSDSAKSNGIDCSNSYTDSKTLPLREYFVKSCFNSAYNGKDLSTNTIGVRLSEGYRFLDLNVFSASGGNLYVGFSQDNAPTLVSTSLPFELAIKYIHENAFVKATVTKTDGVVPSLIENYYKYPLFVHIRTYREPNSKEDIITKIATTLNKLNYSNFYRDSNNKPIKINGCTPLEQLMGKMIFTMDIGNILQIYAPSATPSAEYVPVETIQSIQSVVNMLTGGHTCLGFYDYSDPQIVVKTNKLRISDQQLTGPLRTNVKYLFIVYPHPTNSSNPDSYKLATDNSIQFVPMRAYLSDNASQTLAKYNQLFDDLKVPFAPMSYVYTTVNRNSSSQPTSKTKTQ